MQALQLLNGILKLLLYGIKKHNTCYLIRTQGGVQPCQIPYRRQFSNPAHIHPLRMRQKQSKYQVYFFKILRLIWKKLHDSAFTKNTRSITMAPYFTALTNNNLRQKVPDWRLWAYTDGSCLTYKSQQHVGAGVLISATKTAIYVNSGGVGIRITINRVELTGIASALLRANCTHIAMDSACSLSQTRKQLLFPELHRKRTHTHAV